MKVLIVKTSSMGDVIHTLPALTDAARAVPNAKFDWLVEEGFAEIPSWHPAIDKIIPCALRRWRKNLISTLLSEEWKNFRQQLSASQYDLIIDAQGLIKSAFLARLARGPIYGFDSKSAREPLAALAYKKSFNIDHEQHAVERIRKLFAQSLDYALPDKLGAGNLSAAQFSSDSVKKPYVVFLHGTTRADKFWPVQHWQALCKLLDTAGIEVKIPYHGQSELLRAEQIISASPCATLIPPSNLKQLASILSQAKAFVAVDTGLGHLGAALSVPGISLYGSTDPKKIGAYGSSQIHLSGLSMKEITPESVHNKLLPILH